MEKGVCPWPGIDPVCFWKKWNGGLGSWVGPWVFSVLLSASLALPLASCKDPREDDTVFEPSYFNLPVPDYFPTLTNVPQDNRLSTQGVRLGRYLFYDIRLTGRYHADSMLSCGTCHRQENSFEAGLTHPLYDPQTGGMQGILGKKTAHSMLPLINIAFNTKTFGWNGATEAQGSGAVSAALGSVSVSSGSVSAASGTASVSGGLVVSSGSSASSSPGSANARSGSANARPGSANIRPGSANARSGSATQGQNLEWLIAQTLMDPSEFAGNPEQIVKRLQAIPMYPPLFKEAFGSETITFERVCQALAQFVRTLVSSDSKFDRYMRGEAQLTAEEMKGYVLFTTEEGADCFHCHGGSGNVLFSTYDIVINGLDAAEDFNDPYDRFSVTGREPDKGAYRIPTLRNIAQTAPYMHDGRFSTLDEVIDQYSENVQYSTHISPLMHHVRQGGVQLTPNEKACLKAFLLTLTDESFLRNPNFSNPFVNDTVVKSEI